YWGDYLKDTGHLSTLEHGAYLLLIGHYWSSGTPLPDDDVKLRRIAKVESVSQWRKIKPALSAFFSVGDGVCRPGRIDRELVVALKRSGDAKAKAEKAARARWQPSQDDIPEAQHGAEDEDGPSTAASTTPSAAPCMQRAMHEDCPPQPQSSSPSPTIVVEPIDSAAAASSAAREQPADDDGLSIPPSLRRTSLQAAMVRQTVDEAFALWTPVAYELGISDVGYLNRERRDALHERLAEIGGIEGWKIFLEKLREAEFLRESDGRPKFWVGLSKLLEPEHFSK